MIIEVPLLLATFAAAFLLGRLALKSTDVSAKIKQAIAAGVFAVVFVVFALVTPAVITELILLMIGLVPPVLELRKVFKTGFAWDVTVKYATWALCLIVAVFAVMLLAPRLNGPFGFFIVLATLVLIFVEALTMVDPDKYLPNDNLGNLIYDRMWGEEQLSGSRSAFPPVLIGEIILSAAVVILFGLFGLVAGGGQASASAPVTTITQSVPAPSAATAAPATATTTPPATAPATAASPVPSASATSAAPATTGAGDCGAPKPIPVSTATRYIGDGLQQCVSGSWDAWPGFQWVTVTGEAHLKGYWYFWGTTNGASIVLRAPDNLVHGASTSPSP